MHSWHRRGLSFDKGRSLLVRREFHRRLFEMLRVGVRLVSCANPVLQGWVRQSHGLLGCRVIRNLRRTAAGLHLALLLPTTALQAQPRVGEILVQTPVAGTTPFGSIDAIAIAPDERAWVIDGMASVVYLLDSSGELVTTRGRKGDGPAELWNPCCLTLHGGNLWVLSPDRRRIDVIPSEDEDTRATTRISLKQQVANSFVSSLYRLIVAGGGRSVIVTAERHDPSPDGRDYRRDRVVGLEYDLSGALLREWPNPPLPERYVGSGVVEASYPYSRTRRISLPWPFGPHYEVTRNREGGYAAVFTATYDVSIHGIGGQLVKRIVRPDVTGRQLTSSERNERDDFLEMVRQGVESAGGVPSITGVSDSHPPIDWMVFDAEDRLWVALTPRAQPEWAEGDVYSPSGTFLFRAKWPADVDLSDGAMLGDAAWGVRKGELDEDWLVFLRFSRARHDVNPAAGT